MYSPPEILDLAKRVTNFADESNYLSLFDKHSDEVGEK